MKQPYRFPERFSPVGFTVCLLIFIGSVIWEIKHTYAGHLVEVIGDTITACSLIWCIGMTGYLERLGRRYLKK